LFNVLLQLGNKNGIETKKKLTYQRRNMFVHTTERVDINAPSTS
jgi:hypothetical protein